MSRHRIVRHLIERIIDQMRDMMEQGEGLTKSELKSEHERFNKEIIRQITEVKELDQVDQIEIVRSLEMHSL